MAQAKGSSASVKIDWESSYKTIKASGSRYPKQISFNSCELTETVPLNQAQTIRGDRNPAAPFDGNKDVAGTIVLPVNLVDVGYWLKACIGTPTTTESEGADVKTAAPVIWIKKGIARTFTAPAGGLTSMDVDSFSAPSSEIVTVAFNGTPDLSSVTALTDYVVFGSATNNENNGLFQILSVTDGSDEITVNNAGGAVEATDSPAVAEIYTALAQTGVSVGDKITYNTSVECWVKTITTTSQFVVVDQYGSDNVADTLESSDLTATDVTVASSQATVTGQGTKCCVGNKIVYNTADICYVTNVDTDATVFDIDDGSGNSITSSAAAAAVTSQKPDLDLVIADIKTPTYTHVFKIDGTASLNSLMVEKSYTDTDVPIYERYAGCKVNSLEFNFTAAGDELTMSANVMGASMTLTNDVEVAATVTITDGEAVFSASQTGAAAGDMVVYNSGDSTCYLKSGATDTWKVATKRDGNIAPADITASTVGAVLENAAYDGDTDDAVYVVPTDRFENSHVTAEEGGGAISTFKNIGYTINNDLDGDQFVIGGGGVRGGLPEGIAGVGGTIEAVFEDQTILEKAMNGTESSLSAILTHTTATRTLTLYAPEIRYSEQTPPITGPAGIVMTLDFESYYSDGADESAIVATLVNGHPSYVA